MKRTLPSIDEVICTAQKQTNDRGKYVDTCGHDNARHTISPRFYEDFAERPDTARSASIIETRGGLREALRVCKKKIMRR